MGVITFRTSGSFDRTEKFLKTVANLRIQDILRREAERGVNALRAATPEDSGLAASSWSYTISGGRGGARITWTNSDVENGFPVALMLQYGYGTGTGGYVQGRDYINPAMRPIFDQIAETVWKAVTSA